MTEDRRHQNKKPPRETFLDVLIQSAQRQSAVLHQEATYFEGLLRIRLPEGDNSTSTPQFDSQIGPIRHLKRSTKHVAQDIGRAREAVSWLAELRANAARDPRTGSLAEKELVNLLWLTSATQQWQATLLGLLGELHNRFEQVVKYSIPDHPPLTTRGLRDSTLADRYIAELAHEVHRDLITFSCSANGLNTPHPYELGGRVYVTRVYEPHVHVRWFRDSALHQQWLGWHADNQYDTQGSHRRTKTKKINSAKDEASPASFVTVRMPFWLPDALESLPILAHELAHQVLHDSHGAMSADGWAGQRQTRLTWLLQSLRDELRAPFPDHIDEQLARAYAQELVADAMAFARFREGYLFALATAVFATSEAFAVTVDPYEQNVVYEVLSRLHSGAGAASLSNLVVPHLYAASGLSSHLHRLLMFSRVAVLASVAEAANLSTDDEHADLLRAIKEVVQLAMFPRDANAAARPDDETVVGMIDKIKDVFEGPMGGDSEHSFLDLLDTLWLQSDGEPQKFGDIHLLSPPKESNYFLWRQRISSEIVQSINEKKSLGITVRRGDHISDVVWRLRWHEAKTIEVGGAGASPGSKDPATNVSLVHRQAFRVLLDDYAYRTCNPLPLFELLDQRARRPGFNSVPFDEFFATGKISTRALADSDHARRVYYPATSLAAYLRTGRPVPRNPQYQPQHDLNQFDRARLLGIEDNAESPPSAGPTSQALIARRLGFQQYVLCFWSAAAGLELQKFKQAIGKLGSCNVILGRYDAACLFGAEQAGEELSVDVACGATPIQRRTLSPIFLNGGQNTPAGLDRTIALSLIALSSPLAWGILLRWIENSPDAKRLRSHGIGHELYLSDGWEQAVLLYTAATPTGQTDVVPDIDDMIEMLNQVAGHPVVGRTETLFTGEVFKMKSDQRFDVSFRFRCRARLGTALDSSELEKKLLEKPWPAPLPKPMVRTVSGLTDYEVRINGNDASVRQSFEERRAAAEESHSRLNSAPCSQLVGRLITQIAFRDISLPHRPTIVEEGNRATEASPPPLTA